MRLRLVKLPTTKSIFDSFRFELISLPDKSYSYKKALWHMQKDNKPVYDKLTSLREELQKYSDQIDSSLEDAVSEVNKTLAAFGLTDRTGNSVALMLAIDIWPL